MSRITILVYANDLLDPEHSKLVEPSIELFLPSISSLLAQTIKPRTTDLDQLSRVTSLHQTVASHQPGQPT